MRLLSIFKNPIFRFGLLLITILIVFVIALIDFRNSSPNKTPDTDVQINAGKANSEKLKGVSISPKTYSANDVANFFVEVQKTGNAITWSGEWGDFFGNANSPKSMEQLTRKKNLETIYITGTYNQGEKKIIRKIDEESKKNLKEALVKFAGEIKPRYLGLGVEINIMAENHPTEFENFVELFNESVDEVKAKSPSTQIFTIFQLERLKGLKGGLFGGSNDINKTEWLLLNKFSKADLFAFTTYPGLIYKDPQEIPNDYYTEIKTKTTKPIIFTEIGWPSNSTIAGWESNETEQTAFINKFKDLTTELNPKVIIWSFLYDPDANEPINSMGLIDKSGKKKDSFSTWVAY